jgi:hypothetical protein
MSGYTNSDGSALVGALNPEAFGQALQVDSGGNLKVTSGASDGLGNVSVQDYIRTAITQGKGFLGTSGLLNLGAGTYALSLFNPATSGKSLLVYSVKMSSGGSSLNAQINLVTSNPGFANAVTVANARIGTSSSVASATYASTNQTTSGSLVQIEMGSQNVPIELLLNTSTLLLPSGLANGLIAYITTFASGFLAINVKWLEV